MHYVTYFEKYLKEKHNINPFPSSWSLCNTKRRQLLLLSPCTIIHADRHTSVHMQPKMLLLKVHTSHNV